MNYIKHMHIEGFKKFYELDVQFNEHMNILVGENEAGKSTILDAIRTVLNQQYRNVDKAILKDLFNVKMVEEFKANPSVKTLPWICIEIELELDVKQKNSEYFYGEVYGKKAKQVEKFGITFECRFDQELGEGLEESVIDGKIPYEYYGFTWKTYANRPYKIIKRPLKFLSIDTTSNSAAPSFNYYNKALFTSRYDESVRMRAKNEFRDKLNEAIESVNLPPISTNQKFGVDSNKVVLESVLSVYENSIALENKGSGMESLIKTQIALDKTNGLDVIMMEEPENHLCFTNLNKMLQEISNNQNDSQIIVATHNSMIASRLNLNNVLWIADESVRSLNCVDSTVADFFVKADNNAFLQLLLSKKIFLVEGATEALLLPHFYSQLTGRSLEEDGIVVISCNGISYKKYLAIANTTMKRLAVITDNDQKQYRIDRARQFNEKNDLQHIFMGDTVEEWTWEKCVYDINREELDDVIQIKSGAKYLFHEKDYGVVLGKMLNNKVDTAYEMLISGKEFKIPQYVKDAIKWLNN